MCCDDASEEASPKMALTCDNTMQTRTTSQDQVFGGSAEGLHDMDSHIRKHGTDFELALLSRRPRPR